jgi:hypothetical protein
MSDQWTTHKNRIENLIQTPGTMMSQVLALNPAEIEVDIDVRERSFNRRGYIDCERWVAKVSDNPCRLVAGHNATPHHASIRMTEEEMRDVSQTMSARINVSLSQTVGTNVSTRAGLPSSAEVAIQSSTSSTVGGGVEFVSSETVARRIRSALEVAETIGLDAHITQLCKKWRVPYGLELVVTVHGKAKVRRRWIQNIQNPQTIEWSNSVTVDLSDSHIDASVDPGIDTATSFIEDAPCAICDDGSHLELGDDGRTRLVAHDEGGEKRKLRDDDLKHRS